MASEQQDDGNLPVSAKSDDVLSEDELGIEHDNIKDDKSRHRESKRTKKQKSKRKKSSRTKKEKSSTSPNHARSTKRDDTEKEADKRSNGTTAAAADIPLSPADDSDWVPGEEWKIMSDPDDDEEADKRGTRSSSSSPEKRSAKSASLPKQKKSKQKSKLPRASEKPPRHNSSSGSRRASQSEEAAIRAIMAEKHPWRKQRRRPSTGEDPLNSPLSSLESDQNYRPKFSSLQISTSSQEDEQHDDQGGEEADASSVGTSSGSSSSSSFDVSEDFDDDLDSVLDEPGDDYAPEEAFQTRLAAFPLSFVHPNSMSSPYLDPTLVDELTRTDANRFALEHRILLRSILQLLTERDHVGIEADVNDPDNTVKKGPLLKFSHGGVTGRPNWKIKYVELRRGSFSYFEDNTRNLETPGRKIIPLRSNMCTCSAVNECNVKGAYGYVFELEVQDGPKRLWMVNSEEERQGWIQAIRGAFIGGEIDTSPQLMDMTPHQGAIDKYMMVENELGSAETHGSYHHYLSALFEKSLRIPVPWVRKHLELEDEDGSHPHHRHHHRASSSALLSTPMASLVKSRVTVLWKRLGQESVSINGHLLKDNSSHGTERIIGALTRCILEYDRMSSAKGTMSELQAIVHARNVFMIYYKSRSRDEAYYAVDSLCRNRRLVACLPNVSEHTNPPLHIQVYSAVEEATLGEEEKHGWVTTRSRAPMRWKNRYCIVSEGVLYYYEDCSPTPRGLRGQVVLVGATMDQISIEQDNNLFVLKIVSSDAATERQLCFRNERDMTMWKEAIDRQITACMQNGSLRTIASPKTPRQRKKGPKVKSRIIKGASEMILSKIPQKLPSFDENPDPAEVGNAASTNGRSEGAVAKCEPTVQVVVESSRYYKIVSSASPTTKTNDSILAMVRANYMHTFVLSGGPQGQLSKGDELVEMEFLDGGVDEETFDVRFPRAVGA